MLAILTLVAACANEPTGTTTCCIFGGGPRTFSITLATAVVDMFLSVARYAAAVITLTQCPRLLTAYR